LSSSGLIAKMLLQVLRSFVGAVQDMVLIVVVAG
jgi:hypothetical protein